MNFKLTMALVFVLIALMMTYLLWPSKPEEKKSSAATPLFTQAIKEIRSISYKRNDKEQLAFSHEGSQWMMTAPVQAPAESWSVERITDFLKSAAYKEKFEPEATGARSGESTGTQSPRHVVTFTDDAGRQYTLALGKTTSSGGIYATLNGQKTIYLLDRDPLDSLTQNPQEFRSKNIKDIATDKVTAIRIRHADQTVTLTKVTGFEQRWLIDSPVTARANGSVVDEILKEIKSINASGFSDISKEMQATGLKPAVVEVTAYLNETAATEPATTSRPAGSQPAGKPVTIELGYYTDLTSKKNVYASLGGSPQVFTLSSETFNKLNKELKDLRDPAITPAAVGQATEFTVETAGKPAIKGIRKDGKWTASSGAVSVTSSEKEAEDLLGDMAHLRAIRYSDNAGDLKSIGLDPPQTKIELAVPGQSQREVILVGKPETADKVTPMMRQGEPTVYLVPTGDAEKIIPTLLSLRDKNVEGLVADRIRGITIAGPGAGTAASLLEREGMAWKVKTGGKTEKVDDEKITGLLADFTPLTAVKYEGENANVSGNPDVTVTVTMLEAPAAATAPATTSAPATAPATAPAAMGPQLEKTITHTLKLYKSTKDAKTTWKAVWDGATPQWAFEPTAELVTHVTKETYAAPATQAASQPATEPATGPATMPGK